MKNMDRVILGSVLLIGLGFGLNAQACTTDGWLGGATAATAGSPPIARYSVFCAMQVGNQTGPGYVQSDFANDSTYIGRFYVLPNLTGSEPVDILVAYSDADNSAQTEVFSIAYDGTNFVFDANGAQSTTELAKSGWNLIEFEYNSGTDFKYWVNEVWDFTGLAYAEMSGSVAAGTGDVESVQLGAPNGFGNQTGTLNFDSYESHRTTPVGALLAADANGNGAVNSTDVSSVLIETGLGGALAAGQPDCNENGVVNSTDVSCVLRLTEL